jgi:predicted component of type VI protein secretion system
VRSRYAADRIAASKLIATSSRPASNRSACTSSVIDALACPSIRCTALTFAPALTARLAAVWRRSCGVIDGNVSSLRWHLDTVRLTRARQLELRSTPPRRSVNTSSRRQKSSSAVAFGQRQFPPQQVYDGDDRGIVGVESLSPQGLAFVIMQAVLDVRPVVEVPSGRPRTT